MSEVKESDLADLFGATPATVGNRPRGWWIVAEVEEEEKMAGAEIGDLCIKTRDGGSNAVDFSAGTYVNFRGSSEDGFDCTYRYYYFAPLQTNSEQTS